MLQTITQALQEGSSGSVALPLAFALGLVSAAATALPEGARHSVTADSLGGQTGHVAPVDMADGDPHVTAARPRQEHRAARLIRYSSGKIVEAVARYAGHEPRW